MRPLTFLCTRVYANGSAKEAVRDLEGLASWLSYNRMDRWGNALFVNGHLVHPTDKGYLTLAECRMIETILLAEYEARAPSVVPETAGRQNDYFGGKNYPYHGYAPEPYRAGFRLDIAA